MARFKLFLEYEGTRYRGWQIQKNARTVQGELLHALHTVFNTDQVEFQGAGRTDAGVHALCQVAHLDVQTMLAPEIIKFKVNDLLPADINILEVQKTSPTFHARHDAVARSYVYQIARRRTALGKRLVWWVKDTLDVERMHEAARLFTGIHDFQSFTEDDPEEKSTKLHLETVEVLEHGDLLLIRIVGSHFIWKVVRRMVGVLVEVARRKMSPDDVSRFLMSASDQPARCTAPPSGLFLERVYYGVDTIGDAAAPILNIESRKFAAGRPPETRHPHHAARKPFHKSKRTH